MFTSARVFLCLMIGAAGLVLAGCGRDPAPVAPEAPPEPAAEVMPVTEAMPAAEIMPAADEAVATVPHVPHAADDVVSGGGEAHVHGLGEFAVAVDANQLTVTLDAPLANFGFGEGDADAMDVSTDISEGLVSFKGGADCQPGSRSVTTRTIGGHSSLTLELGFTCSDISKLEGVRLNAFTVFPHFEAVDAVFIGPDAQVASVLTPGNPELSTRLPE